MLSDDDAMARLVVLRASGSTEHLHPGKAQKNAQEKQYVLDDV